MEQQEECNRKLYYSIIDRFLRKNKELFTNYELNAIKHYVLHGNYPEAYHKDILREIFDKLALIPTDENVYITFMNDILRHYDIQNKHIIEVGGGMFPNLASRLSTKQQNGKITVFDPRLDPRCESSSKLILKKEKFARTTPVDDADLIIGLMPCKGIDILVDQAIENNKDFMVWFCEGGPHGDYFDYFEDENEWYHCMMVTLNNGVERQNMGKIKTIEHPRFSRYPVVYNEREKKYQFCYFFIL